MVGHTADIRTAEWPLDSQHFNAQQVWHYGQGAGVTIAVLDSGVDAQHSDLIGQVTPGVGYVGMTGDTGETDQSGDSHGTSIAAIIAGTGRGDNGQGMIGLAPKATILPIRVTLDNTTAPVALAKGIFYAVDHQAKIINISAGMAAPDPTIQAAVNYAINHGVILVAAAGNEGAQGNPALYPATIPGVLNVTGTDQTGQFWTSSESGPDTTIAAPAVNIYSAADNGQYLTGDGTSYAAPYVAATAALVWSEHPNLTTNEVIRQLLTTADPHGAVPHDDRYGAGILDPLRAVTSPPSNDNTNPFATPPTLRTSPTGPPIALIAGIAAAALLTVVTSVLIYRRRKTNRCARQLRNSTKKTGRSRQSKPKQGSH
jgi:type VII secretion-associated serine protease mycosin